MLPPVARAVRNANPGNLERGSINWLGLASTNDMTADQRAETRFCVFIEPKYGFRALAVLLRTYHDRYGLTTVRQIISRFAPPMVAGRKENDTDAYVKAVCDGIGREPDAALDLNDPATLTAMCRAIAVHEAGGWLFETDDLNAGVAMALGKSPQFIAQASTNGATS